MSIFYLRRTDGVYGYTFDGSRTAAEDISDALHVKVEHVITPGHQGVLLIDGYEGTVNHGDVVVVNTAREIVDVISSWDFHAKYSKDGL